MQPSATLNARQVCQRLRDAALGVYPLHLVTRSEGQVQVEIGDWRLLLDVDGSQLQHCRHCRSAEGLEWQLDARQRFGTDPVSLLSTWELAQVGRLLQALEMAGTERSDGN